MATPKKTKIKPISSDDSHLLQLLYTILVIAILSLVFFVFNAVNTRGQTNVLYNYSKELFEISNDVGKKPVYIENNWVFVPNIQRNQIRFNSSVESFKSKYPYADHVSINKNGWSNLGENAQWYGIDDELKFIEFNSNGIKTISGAYMTTLRYGSEISNLYLDLGAINGHAFIYCNGHFVGEAGDMTHYAIIPNYNGAHNATSIQSGGGKIELLILCYSSNAISSPGLLSIPTLLPPEYNTFFATLPTSWLAIIITLTIIAILAGYNLKHTFKDSRVYTFFVLTIISLILYYIIDNSFLIMDSITKTAGKLIFFIASAAFSYCFVAFLFRNKNSKLKKVDCIIISCIGIAFIALSLLDPRLLSTPYNKACTIIYVSIIAATNVAKVLFLHLDSKNAIFGSCASVTMFFTFYAMLSETNLLVNVSLYSIFYFLSLLSIIWFFINRYVSQYSELVRASTHLKVAIEQKTAHISEINRDLVNTNKKLLSNEEARKNVMSNVSHDLRTPITAIRGYAELLLKGGSAMSEDQKNSYLNNILKRSQQMERIVSDIVEISKMEASNFEFNFMDISLNELLDELYMLYSADLPATKKLTLSIPEDDLMIVKADPKRINRVFENLISNSINYTKEEALIEIKVWRENADKPLNDQEIHITISDNGIGIPPEEIERIFDRFYRAKNSGQNIKGTGLGLAIVKMIIDNHNAKISVESEIGIGTTFHIVMKPSY